jgi:hypothetical protein
MSPHDHDVPGPGSAPSRADRILAPFFSDVGLWPVTLVTALALSTFGASALLLAFASGSRLALAALALLAVATGDAVWRSVRERRRLGTAAAALLGLWVLSALIALLAHGMGIW